MTISYVERSNADTQILAFNFDGAHPLPQVHH